MVLTINETTYEFEITLGFLKKLNAKAPIDVGGSGIKKNQGLGFTIMFLLDGDVETLVEVLLLANKGKEPKLTEAVLEGYIANKGNDIDELFKEVLDFFEESNFTKKKTVEVIKAYEEDQKKS